MMTSEEFAYKLKNKIIDMAVKCKGGEGYWGGYLSLVDILAVLYNDVMKLDSFAINRDMCDKLILSKGHSGLALYCAMNIRGLLADDKLQLYDKSWSPITHLASYNPTIGLELSGGSLGLGLPYGLGLALLAKKKNYKYNIYVILGDGEIQEGSNWEAAFCASKYELNNLIVIVDNNHFQSDGACSKVMPTASLKDKFKSFGWHAIEIDGHDHRQLKQSFSDIHSKPTAIIANTIKGKGVSFMENNNEWHHTSLRGELLEKARKEVKGDLYG